MEERMPYSTVSDNLAEINELFDIPANKLTNIGQVLKAMADRDHTPLEIRTDANGHEVNAYPAAIWQEFWEKVASRDLPQKMLAMLRPEEEKWQPISQQRIEAVKAKVAELEQVCKNDPSIYSEANADGSDCKFATSMLEVEILSDAKAGDAHDITMIKLSTTNSLLAFPCNEETPLCKYLPYARQCFTYADSPTENCICFAVQGAWERADLFPLITCALATLKD